MGIKNIEDLVNMIQQIQLLNSLQSDMSHGQLPNYLMKDRSVNQGEIGHDRMFSNQGVAMSYGSSGGDTNVPIQLPESDRPAQENVPVTFSDFFGNPQYNYEQSIMMPKKDDIDD
tara:strand:- start:146 stop:490 length:345 start_codon:yes stop_codon:yes gene_type:complete